MREVRPRCVLANDMAMRTLRVFMNEPYVSVASLAKMLFIDEATAEDALAVFSVAGADGKPLIVRHTTAGWLLGGGAWRILGSRLRYLRPAEFDDLTGVDTFLSQFGLISCKDLAAMQGFDVETAEDVLDGLTRQGVLMKTGPDEYLLHVYPQVKP
ncbi:MAG: DUF5635 domain-containing protein [Corynebacterium glucuronolyticum]|nr:DUF5635 domain-containing protein [Corynebacterium glucuronolyticum]